MRIRSFLPFLLLAMFASAITAEDAPTIEQRVAATEADNASLHYTLESVPLGVFQRLADQNKAIKAQTAVSKQQQDALNVHHDQIQALYAASVAKDEQLAALQAQVATMQAQIAALLGNG